jgi:hypothetical protein
MCQSDFISICEKKKLTFQQKYYFFFLSINPLFSSFFTLQTENVIDPQPSINWRKNGKKVSNTQSRYSVMEHNGLSLLRIEPVRAGRDDAPYECIAENGVGDAVSAEATLTVYEPDKTPAGFPTIEVINVFLQLF